MIRRTTLRKLLYFPIIHTKEDLGIVGNSVEQMNVKHFGRRGHERHKAVIDHLWTEIEMVIQRLQLDFLTTRVYQDGLPICGYEMEIVQELALSGSRNHKLLISLSDKGATIMGTESPDFLIEEYQLTKQSFSANNSLKKMKIDMNRSMFMKSLLSKRDQFIADRIDHTLLESETGIVFLGMMHSLQPYLSKNIIVHYPLYKPLSLK